MKKIVVTFFYIFVVCINVFAQYGYRFQGNEVKLRVDSSMYFVQTTNEQSSIKQNASLKQRVKEGEIKSFYSFSNNRFLIYGDKAQNKSEDYYSPIYKNEQNEIIIILPRVVVMLKEGNDIGAILKKYSEKLSIESGNQYKYILECNLLKSEEVLKIVNELSNRTDVDWCEPELLSEIKFYNSLYTQQYYLNNSGQNGGTIGIDINVLPAWNLTNGSSNVIVAVIDQGVDNYHEDMGGCVLEGYTIRNATGFGAPQNENSYDSKGHGMACSGIIAASNNTVGIRGIASNIQILPINIDPDFAYLDYWGNTISGFGSSIEIAQAINWAWHRADVLSNSWGGGAYSNEIVTAIDSARIYGRNGKGTIVVFASGNNYPYVSDVSFPATVNGVITVGAINNSGTIWNYSQRGASMDLVAPSGDVNLQGDVTTTDRMGNLGYNTTNYMNNFGGTSAACPQVAGVVALMLSVNPDLTETQVRTTLQSTARDLGSSGFDNTYGYGLVNAYAAVSAVSPFISGPSQICDNGTFTLNNLPSGATINWRSSDSFIFRVISGQGTDSATYEIRFPSMAGYVAQVIADITINSQVTTITKDVQLGTAIPQFSIFDASSGAMITTNSVHTGIIYNFVVDNVPLTPVDYNYHWEVTPPDNEPGVDPQYITLGSGQSMSYMGRIPGTYTVSLKHNGVCGWSLENERVLNMSGQIIGLLFSVSPNPASEVLTVSMASSKSNASGELTSNSSDKGIGVEPYTIKLYNAYSGLVRTVEGSEPTIQIPIQDLPKGTYFIHLIRKEKILQKQIVWVK
jgi:serine protease